MDFEPLDLWWSNWSDGESLETAGLVLEIKVGAGLDHFFRTLSGAVQKRWTTVGSAPPFSHKIQPIDKYEIPFQTLTG